ncbi:MAG: UbiA family prenyltransferase [Candidatus Krumholzibacteriota bacterium]|nr:UbiA family prenyltransferase [Candidatus Krumholzibacteriota bacterium]
MRRFIKIIMIIRPHNVAAAVLCVLTGYLLAAPGYRFPLPLLAAVALVTAAGNLINDYYDLDIDSINKPRRALPSGSVSAVQVRSAYYLLLAVAAVLLIHTPAVMKIWIAVWVLLLHLYSALLKRRYLYGNLVVSVVTGSGFLLGAYAGGRIIEGIFPAAGTSLFVLGREFVKDCEDIEGDRRCGARTFSVVSGEKAALRAAAFLFLLLAAAFPMAGLMGYYSRGYTGVMLISVLPILVISSIFSLRGEHPAFSSLLLKLGMFFGIAAFLLS